MDATLTLPKAGRRLINLTDAAIASEDVDIFYIARLGNVRRMGGVDNLRVVIVQSVEKGLLDMGMDVRLRLLDDKEVGEGLLHLLVFEFQKFQGQVNEVGAAKAGG